MEIEQLKRIFEKVQKQNLWQSQPKKHFCLKNQCERKISISLSDGKVPLCYQGNDLDDIVSDANEEGCNHDGDDVAGSLPCDLFSRRFRNEAFAGAGQARGHTLG